MTKMEALGEHVLRLDVKLTGLKAVLKQRDRDSKAVRERKSVFRVIATYGPLLPSSGVGGPGPEGCLGNPATYSPDRDRKHFLSRETRDKGVRGKGHVQTRTGHLIR